MRNFLLSRFISSNPYRRKTPLCFIQQNAFFIISSFTSKANSQLQQQKLGKGDQFTVSYLIKSCGLSPKIAIQASKVVCLKNPDTADSVLNLLKNYGFSESQVSKFVKRRPRLLLADSEETLLPKIKFLQSIGVSSTELPEILVSNPLLLERSLTRHLIPYLGNLRSVLFDNDELIKVLKRGIWCVNDMGDHVVPNIRLLREFGVPQRWVSFLVTCFPDVAFKKHTKFAKAVKSAKGMGFDSAKSSFIQAVQVLAKMTQSGWESKLEVFERWGWSKDVALSAFGKCPNYILCSKEKIRKVMNFLVNEMGFSALYIAESPGVLCYSLEKRIIPRCLVIRTLKSKGLLKIDLSLSSILVSSEKKFFNLYVARFQDPDKAQMCPSDVIQP